MTVKPAISLWTLAPHLPWPYHVVDQLGRVLSVTPGVTRSRIALANCAADLYEPRIAREDRFVVYLHGGAFLIGGNHLHRSLISRFADMQSTRMLAVEYRKLPEHAISRAVADGVDGYRHALELGYRPDQIVFMGDSAGGYLALMVAIEARDQGLPTPGAVVSISPLTDWNLGLKIAAPSADKCAMFPRGFGKGFLEIVTAAHERSATPLRSPVDCDLTNLPPVLVQGSTSEMLYPDIELIAQRINEQGGRCELQVWRNQVHVFHAAAGFVPEADQAISMIGDFLTRTLDGYLDSAGLLDDSA